MAIATPAYVAATPTLKQYQQHSASVPVSLSLLFNTALARAAAAVYFFSVSDSAVTTQQARQDTATPEQLLSICISDGTA